MLFARALDRAGKGLRSAPRDALIADSVNANNRGAAFGWHRAMDTFGAAVGPLLAIGLLSLNSNQLRPLYYWALIPGLISVIIIFLIKEPKQSTENKKWESPLRAWSGFGYDFKKYVLVWGVFSLTNSSDVFLLMKAKASGLTTESVILLYCVYNLIYSFSSPYLGKLSDQIGRKKILIGGLIVFSFVYLGFGFANQSWHYWMLFMIYGFYMAATEGVGKALAIDLSPAKLKATGVGILGTIMGISTIFASVMAGLIWDNFGSSWTFIYGAAGALITTLIIMKMNINTKINT